MTEPDQPTPPSSIILYQTNDGHTRVQCRFENQTLWLTQALIAELFDATPQNVTLHLKAIYEEKELDQAATCKEYLQVRTEGTRQVSRSLLHYSLPAILPDAGSISRETADAKALHEYETFSTRRRAALEAAAENDMLRELEQGIKNLPPHPPKEKPS